MEQTQSTTFHSSIGVCRYCGRTGYLIPSNNPLVAGDLCEECINKMIDPSNLEHFAFFARTYNFPANVNLYLSCLRRSEKTAIRDYVEQLYTTGTVTYSDATTDCWKEVEKEWAEVKTHRRLLEKVNEIKVDFIERMHEKWGGEYSFEELMQLESQFNSIITALNVSNPTQLENIKKVCKMSVLVDQYIQGGETKAILEGTNALAKLTDIAQINEMTEVASEGTIKTVADLYKYMEDHGWRWSFYDKVDRDIVDTTIKDIQQSIRTEINNATGLDVTLQNVKENYLRTEEEQMATEAQADVPIQDILELEKHLDSYSEEEMRIDQELDAQEVIFEDEE